MAFFNLAERGAQLHTASASAAAPTQGERLWRANQPPEQRPSGFFAPARRQAISSHTTHVNQTAIA
jgi:hypothetical protein